MAGPITWRTVQGASLADAARPLALASDAITGGFDRLGALVEKQQGVNQGFVDRADEAVTQNFLERLQSAKSPEQIAAMEASGELASMRASLKPKQLAQVRGAEDARTAGLMTQLTQRNTFQDAQLARERAPGITKAEGLLASGDFAGFDAYINSVDLGSSEPGLITKAYDLRRSRKTNDRTEQLADVTFPGQLADARFVESTRQDREALAKQELLAKGRTLTAQEQAATDSEQDRLVANLTQQTAAAYQSSLQEDKLKLGTVAKQLGFEVDAAGFPTVDRYTNDQLNRLRTAAKAGGIRNQTELFAGDTAMANQFIAALGKDSRINPATLLRNQSGILGAFDSTKRPGAIGNDLATQQRQQAQADVVQKEQDDKNWYAPGSPEAIGSYEQLAAEAPNLIDATSGIDPEEDVRGVQKFIYKMGTVGLDMGNGKFLTPSANDIRAAIRAAEGGWFRDGKRSENAEKFLKAQLNTKRVDELLKQAEQSKMANRNRAVRELLNPSAPAKK